MKLVSILIVCVCVFSAFNGFGQSGDSDEAVIVYDPLFWKDELKLNANQYQTIQNINKEFYEEIYKMADKHDGNIPMMQTVSQELLETRSEKIWRTFAPKQKKIWKKLSSFYSMDEENSYSRHHLKSIGINL